MKTLKVSLLLLLVLITVFAVSSCTKEKEPLYYEDIPTDDQIMTELKQEFKDNPLTKDVIEIETISIVEKYDFSFFGSYTVRVLINDKYTFDVVYRLTSIQQDSIVIKRWMRESIKEVL